MRPNLLESTTVLKIIELEKEITIINLLNKKLDENNKKLEEDKKQLEQNLENQQKENTEKLQQLTMVMEEKNELTGKLKTLEERLKTENIKKSQTENEIKEFKTEISKLKEAITKKELEYAEKFENQIFAIKSQLYEEKANSNLDVIERDQKILALKNTKKSRRTKYKINRKNQRIIYENSDISKRKTRKAPTSFN
jgi:hypothetical protein